jgi:hypothetical protein
MGHQPAKRKKVTLAENDLPSSKKVTSLKSRAEGSKHPSFGFRVEMEFAARVKCPIHGDRSKSWYFTYSPKWHRERQKICREGLSPQFKKAWLASFPPDLWPAEEEETADGTYLRLRDGTRLLEGSSVGGRTET